MDYRLVRNDMQLKYRSKFRCLQIHIYRDMDIYSWETPGYLFFPYIIIRNVKQLELPMWGQ